MLVEHKSSIQSENCNCVSNFVNPVQTEYDFKVIIPFMKAISYKACFKGQDWTDFPCESEMASTTGNPSIEGE